MKLWLEFVAEYRELIQDGSIVVVNDRFLDWCFRYHRGSDSDKAIQACFDAHLQNYSYQFWKPEFTESQIAHSKKEMAGTALDEKRISDQLFWLETYATRTFLTFESIDHARYTYSHCKGCFSNLKKNVVPELSVGSTMLSTGFVFDGAMLSAQDVVSVRNSDEALAKLRKAVSALAASFSQGSEDDFEMRLSEHADQFKAAVSEIETAAGQSNFPTGLMDRSRDGWLAAIGGGTGAFIGEATLTAITGACAGGMLPVLFNLPKHVGHTKEAKKLQVSGKLLASALTK